MNRIKDGIGFQMNYDYVKTELETDFGGDPSHTRPGPAQNGPAQDEWR